MLICGIALPAWCNSDGRLFHFERSKNKNIVCYDIQLKDGNLNLKDPCDVYWLRLETTGVRKELSYIEQRFGYGYKVKSKSPNEAIIQLTAYKDLPVKICKRQNKWVAVVALQGQETILEKIYVKSHPDNSLKVQYVEITATSISTGQKIIHRIMR